MAIENQSFINTIKEIKNIKNKSVGLEVYTFSAAGKKHHVPVWTYGVTTNLRKRVYYWHCLKHFFNIDHSDLIRKINNDKNNR